MKCKKICDVLLSILIGMLIAIILRNHVFINAIVPTGSMEPTIMVGDRLFASRLAYRSSEPQRGDVVAFYNPEDNETVFAKRVIGLPGETVNIVDGKVYINDSDTPLSEEYLKAPDKPVGDFGPYVVPENGYFVLGDNRNKSHDSRFWKTTSFVPKDNIIAKVVFKYWSLGRFEFEKIK